MGADSTPTPTADGAGRAGRGDAGRSTTHDPVGTLPPDRGGVPPAGRGAADRSARAYTRDRPAAPDPSAAPDRAAAQPARPYDFAAVRNYASPDGRNVVAGRLAIPRGGRFDLGRPLVDATGAEAPLFDGVPHRGQVRGGKLGDPGVILAIASMADHDPYEIGQRFRPGPNGSAMYRLDQVAPLQRGIGFQPIGEPTNVFMTPDVPVLRSDPRRSGSADQSRTGVAWPAMIEKAHAAVDMTWREARQERDAKEKGGSFRQYDRLDRGTNFKNQAEIMAQSGGVVGLVLPLDTRPGQERAVQARMYRHMERNEPFIVLTRQPRSYQAWPIDVTPSQWYEAKLTERGQVQLISPSGRMPRAVSVGDMNWLVDPYYVTTRR